MIRRIWRLHLFTGFTDATMEFFLGLRFDNSKRYMDEHRQLYTDEVRLRFYSLIEDLAPAALQVDPEMEVRPHKCLSRINRDTRFSADKSPYRDHLWFCFRKAGADKNNVPCFWFELGPDHMDWGCGTWFEQREMMEVVRRRMLAHPDDFIHLLDVIERSGLYMGGNRFKRMAVPDELPERLRGWWCQKDVFVSRPVVSMKPAFTPGLVEAVRRDYLTLKPFYTLMKGCMEQAMEEIDAALKAEADEKLILPAQKEFSARAVAENKVDLSGAFVKKYEDDF